MFHAVLFHCGAHKVREYEFIDTTSKYYGFFTLQPKTKNASNL